MSGVRLHGAPYSVYVRICRIALAEKGVSYMLEPVDVFAAGGVPAAYLQRNPFGRIPAFEHDGFTLFETDAIVGYVDEAFDGPALMPADAPGRARMRQIMRIADTVLYAKGVWQLYVAWKERGEQGDVSAAAQALDVIGGLAGTPFLCGDRISLADAYVYAMVRYMAMAPAGRALLDEATWLSHWIARMDQRSSIDATRYPVELERESRRG